METALGDERAKPTIMPSDATNRLSRVDLGRSDSTADATLGGHLTLTATLAKLHLSLEAPSASSRAESERQRYRLLPCRHWQRIELNGSQPCGCCEANAELYDWLLDNPAAYP